MDPSFLDEDEREYACLAAGWNQASNLLLADSAIHTLTEEVRKSDSFLTHY
jgi:hypothetical protein